MRARHVCGLVRLVMNTEKSADYLQECRAALSAEQALSLSLTENWAHVDRAQVHNDWDALYKRLTPLLQNCPASAPEVQALMEEHYRIVSRFYTPSKMAYIGMSIFYAENTDMANFHKAYHPSMVAFLAEAIPIYAEANL